MFHPRSAAAASPRTSCSPQRRRAGDRDSPGDVLIELEDFGVQHDERRHDVNLGDDSRAVRTLGGGPTSAICPGVGSCTTRTSGAAGSTGSACVNEAVASTVPCELPGTYVFSVMTLGRRRPARARRRYRAGRSRRWIELSDRIDDALLLRSRRRDGERVQRRIDADLKIVEAAAKQVRERRRIDRADAVDSRVLVAERRHVDLSDQRFRSSDAVRRADEHDGAA